MALPPRIGFFRGVPFRLGSYDFQGGRRNALHEYPLRDEPLAEDLGRRGRRFQFQAHVIGTTWELQRNALLRALEAKGPGLLIHPYLGQHTVLCDTFSVTEANQRRIAQFTLAFLETAGFIYPRSAENPTRGLSGALGAAWDA